VSEAGLPKFEYLTWYGMMAPAGTPASVVGALHRDTARALRLPSWSERFTQQGLDVFVTPPAEFGRYLGAELARWDALVRKAGIRVE
jgi:tripartite-type tricarboxylate transporter receptor subunit TctC